MYYLHHLLKFDLDLVYVLGSFLTCLDFQFPRYSACFSQVNIYETRSSHLLYRRRQKTQFHQHGQSLQRRSSLHRERSIFAEVNPQKVPVGLFTRRF